MGKKNILWSLLIQLAVIVTCNASITPYIESKYRVHYLNTSIPESVAQEILTYKNDTLAGSFEILNINSSKDSKYLCYIPQYTKIEDNDNIANNSLSWYYDKIKNAAVSKINDTFSIRDCLYFNSINTGSYWTFGYCFGDKIIQFHEDLAHFITTKEHKAEYPAYVYVLGRFDGPSESKVSFENQSKWNQSLLNEKDFEIIDDSLGPITPGAVLKQSKSQKMIKHTLTDGTVCDLTGDPRSIEIVYKCDPNNKGIIAFIDFVEIKTCQYQLVLSVPSLCQIDELRPIDKKNEVIDIDCRLISKEGNLDIDSINTDIFFNLDQLLEKQSHWDFFDVFNKITISDFTLTPMGKCFYVATSKDTKQQHLNKDIRTVMLYNGINDSLDIVTLKLGQTFAASLGKRINSPIAGDSGFIPLSWDDTFILWIELYDHLGDFIGLAKLERNGADKHHDLVINIIDPVNMVDYDGNNVTLPTFDKSFNGWGYEKFIKAGTENEVTFINEEVNNSISSAVSSTVTVTVTEKEQIEITTVIESIASLQPEYKEDLMEVIHDEL